MARTDIVNRIVSNLGSSTARVMSLGDGWPSLVEISTTAGDVVVAMHATTMNSHARKPYERRVQAPASGKPISSPGGALPLYVASVAHQGRSLLFAADASYRIGLHARSGPLFHSSIIDEARTSGWGRQIIRPDQVYYVIFPSLLPTLVDALASGVEIDLDRLRSAIVNAGLADGGGAGARERAKRLVEAYIRDARFSRDVRRAYEERCAMCQVGLGLVAGAHILPVSAPGAPDKVWNGMALCHNHHSAFDKHSIWVGRDYRVRVSPALRGAAQSAESARFLRQTRGTLWVPTSTASRPKATMLAERYAFYHDKYDWAPAF